MGAETSNGFARHLVLGVDPGITGALALVDLSESPLGPVKSSSAASYGRIEGLWDIPLLPPNPGNKRKSTKKKVDIVAIGNLIGIYANRIRFAVIEEAQVMSGREGVVSMFNYGRVAGILEGIILAYNVPTYMLKPAAWKATLNLTSDKKESLYLARKLYPDCSYLNRMKDHNRAEALLMAVCAIKVLRKNGRL